LSDSVFNIVVILSPTSLRRCFYETRRMLTVFMDEGKDNEASPKNHYHGPFPKITFSFPAGSYVREEIIANSTLITVITTKRPRMRGKVIAFLTSYCVQLVVPAYDLHPKIIISTNSVPAQEVSLDVFRPHRVPSNLPRYQDRNGSATKATPETRAIRTDGKIGHVFVSMNGYSMSFFQVCSQVTSSSVARMARTY
jgi:hypothetical protein